MTSLAGYAGATDTGRKRRRNEDAYVLAPPIFAVADGMGGAQAGEIASKLAATVLEDTDSGQLSGRERVTSLIREANARVYERSNADPAASGMGTTMTVALIEGSDVTIGHVGDSRAYLVRAGKLEQVTEDHSLVNELLKSGRLSPEEAVTHPQRSVITRAVGTDPDVDVDAFPIEAQDGDVFLICSDGLTDMLEDGEILDVVERYPGDLDRVTKSLVSAANRGGGEDNITVVAFSFADGGDTAQMGAVDGDPPTRENVLDGDSAPVIDTMVIPAAEVEDSLIEPEDVPTPDDSAPRAARVRLVLGMLVLLAVVAAILVWRLLR